MNNIPLNQNKERHLQQLEAQRQLYSTAKKIFGFHSFVSLPLTISLAVIAAWCADIKPYTALWGIAVSFMDLIWLTPWTKRLRTRAARIQEVFDCEVLEIPQDELRTGNPPDPELIKEQSEKYQRWASEIHPITNWYAVGVGELPMYLARLICQRSNCWWDSKQRRSYANTFMASAIFIFFVILIVAIAMNSSINSFILAFNTLLPVFIFSSRQYLDNIEAAERLENIKTYIERSWDRALKNKNDVEATAMSRTLQGEIYDSRKRSPLVFDFIFKRLRNDYESQMNHGAICFIEEAKKSLAKKE
ncbi:MAG: S-4TM family putative pore-forming effector [Bacteriovorax sp.]|nr:S-4TM family putative pore-forming effector [Bacteriovorax sp.]